MVPISLTCIAEERLAQRTSLAEYSRATWQLLRSRAFFFVVLWQLLNPAVQYVHSTENLTGLARTFFASGVNGALYGLVIMGLELTIFGVISKVMTEFENYRTQLEFESSYVFKMFFYNKKHEIYKL